MKLTDLARWIDIALEGEPPKSVAEICGKYYQPYYYFMYLSSFVLPGIAVELGVHNGRGCGCMALSTASRIIGLDNSKHPDLEKIERQFPNFTFLNLPSLPVPELIQKEAALELTKISLLHIDTEHSYAMAKAEFEAYKPYLDTKAIVIFDDLHAQENDVLKYFMELPYPKIQCGRMHPITGWGVMLYEQ